MTELNLPPAVSTRDKLLQAAMRVFARDGIHAATTRAIAQDAGVNEVTLFRHFQSKEGLLGEVMKAAVQTHHQHTLGDEAEWTGNLKKNLKRFAEGFYAMLERDEAFIRTMIGEARRHPDHAKKVIMEAIKPVRSRFIANLQAAQKAGLVRRGLDLAATADAFTAMLLGGMLRNTAHCIEDYTPPEYVAACVDIFAAGLAPAPRA